MNNSYYNVSHSRDYYKGKSVEFAGEWTSGVRYFNDEYLNSLVVYTEKDTTGNIIHSALLACKKTHIAAYNSSITDSTNNQPHLVIDNNFGVIGIEPNDYWIFISGSLVGTPGKSAEIVNTYLEALTFAAESNIGKIVFVKEEKSAYLIIGAGELKKIVSTSELLELAENKVDKEPGKGLSTNDYSNTEKTKLEGIEENAQRNIIEEIDLNGVKIEPVNKVVSINVDAEVTEDSNNLVTSGAVYEKLELKQNTLIPGNGIKIENNKIDITPITESETQPDTSIWVNPSENTEVELTYNRSQIDTLISSKQDKLIAGNGIQIVNSTISSTVDTNPFIVVSQLPSVGENGKIYLTPAEKPENNNLADEWIWNNNSWERLGSASVDLSNYPKLVDLTDIINNEIDNYITEERFNELKELLSTSNTIFYFNKDGMYYYSTSIDLSKISNTPSGNDYENIENIAIYFPKKQDGNGVYGYKLVLSSGFNAASYDFYWNIYLVSSDFSVRVYNGSIQGLVPAPTYGSTKKYLNVNGQWTTVKSSELDNDSGFITASDISVKVDKEEGKGLSSNDYTNEEKAKLASLENYNDTEIKGLINQKVNDTDLAKVAKTGKYSDLIDEPLIKSSQAPTNNEPLWVNPDEDPKEVEVYNRSQVDALLNTKQSTLIPGNGIIIEGNVISSTGGGESGGSIDLSSYAKKTDVETALAGKQDIISDLADIKEGANKGKTALQSYNETDPVYTADKPSLALKSELATKQDKLTAGNGISIVGNVISSTVDSLITPITYAELVALRDSSSLVAGMQYRITDYACTTTQENTQSAGHPFDIIVTADSENTLNDEARAIQHEGDTYFADCDLNAWKIWYCLDNDASRFAWADSTNGKGVIYRMIDEWNNDVPYDFKNIMFKRDWSEIAPDSGLTGFIYCYTFSIFLDGFSENVTASDESIKAKECIESDGDGMFGNNVIRPYQEPVDNYFLNDIIFVTDRSHFSVIHYFNTFGNGCSYSSFGSNCYSNTFGNNCSSNTFGSDCYFNTFGNDCSSNTFGSFCYSNTFGNNCSSNTFGSDCYFNTFGNSCYYILFTSTSSEATRYNYYSQNHFGDGCQYIVFKGAETASYSSQVQNYNFVQGLQGTSSAYLTIDGVRSRAYETKVAKNSSGELKIYCEADLIQ